MVFTILCENPQSTRKRSGDNQRVAEKLLDDEDPFKM